jgi:hypothetical protein
VLVAARAGDSVALMGIKQTQFAERVRGIPWVGILTRQNGARTALRHRRLPGASAAATAQKSPNALFCREIFAGGKAGGKAAGRPATRFSGLYRGVKKPFWPVLEFVTTRPYN